MNTQIKKFRTLTALVNGWKKAPIIVVEMMDGSRWYVVAGDGFAYKTEDQIRSGIDLRKINVTDYFIFPAGINSPKQFMELIP